jgi:hypothetical protein
LILGRDHAQQETARQFFLLGQVALWVVLVVAVMSGIDYYRRFNRLIVRAVEPGGAPPSPSSTP